VQNTDRKHHPSPAPSRDLPAGSAAHIRAENVHVTLGERPVLTAVQDALGLLPLLRRHADRRLELQR